MFQLGYLLNYKNKINIIGFLLLELECILVKCSYALQVGC